MVDEQSLRDAFVELHSERLHGFAMLVTLGDRALAGALAAEALAQGSERIAELRHPERAAAWLRAGLTDAARGPAWGHRRPTEEERRDVLATLGVDPTTFDGLASLDVRGRAAVVAAHVERLSPIDVAEIVDGGGRVRKARRDFVAEYLRATRSRGSLPPQGPLTSRLQAIASGLLSGVPSP